MKLFIVQLLHSPVTSALLGPNTFFRITFSNTQALFTLPLTREIKFHNQCKTIGRIMVLYALTFTTLNRMVASIPRILSVLNLFFHAILIC
jgi:hypothetical protein